MRIFVFLAPVLLAMVVSGCGGGGGTASLAPVSTDASSVNPTRLSAPAATASEAQKSVLCSLFGQVGADPADTAARFDCYTARSCDKAGAAAYKQANPQGVVLLYVMSAAVSFDSYAMADPDNPMGYVKLDAEHPNWFLLDARHNRIKFNDFEYYALDPANTEYQKAWADDAIRLARDIGADGVMLDNINSFHEWSYSTPTPKYPTAASYAQAMDSFVRYVTGRLHAEGLLAVGNGASETWNSGYWASWISIMDGRVYEPPEGSPDEDYWAQLLNSFASNPDKLYIYYYTDADSYPDKALFEIGSFLLWQGSQSYLGTGFNIAAVPSQHPLASLKIGKPSGACQLVGVSTYHRSYDHGDVYVNISRTKSETIRVSKGTNAVTGASVQAGNYTLDPRSTLVLSQK